MPLGRISMAEIDLARLKNYATEREKKVLAKTHSHLKAAAMSL